VREAAVVTIASGDELGEAGGGGGAGIALAHAAAADEGDLNLVVGGDLGRLVLRGQQGKTKAGSGGSG